MDPLAIVADVTDLETRPPAYPEHVAALEARGFRVLGRFATLGRPSRDDIAYKRPERARLDDWRLRTAASVLVAPDGTSFAGVDTFGDARMLRLRTELDDGSIVETLGIESSGVLRPRFGRDPFATFKVVATADHSVRVIDDPSPDAVMAEHADHVTVASARREAQPVRHSERDHALRLASMHADHMSRVVSRGKLMIRLCGFALLAVVAGVFIWNLATRTPSFAAVLLLELLMLVVTLAAVVGVAVVVARTSWWRPPYLVDR